MSLIFVTSRGTLSDERIVTVKQLSVASRQGKSQFVTEIYTISAVQHHNLVNYMDAALRDIGAF